MARNFTRLLICLFLLCSRNASALNVLVTQTSGSPYTMPASWQSVLTAMGHTVNIQPNSVLDNNSFFATTNVLIVSDGTATYSATQINTIKAFLQSGKPVYLQSEYLSTYGGNTAFAQIVTALGSSFTWGATQNNDQNPNILGTFATTNNSIPSLPYFWYGCTGTAGANIFTFIKSTPGNAPLGWCFCPANSSYGKLITCTDQDWIQNITTYPLGVNLMENIFTHLITPGLCGSSSGPSATIIATSNVSCFGGNNGSATISVSGGTPPYTYSWAPSGGSGASISGRTAGAYTCTVTDAGSQTDTITVNITQPTALVSSGSQVNACGSNTGSATVVVSGGTPPYTYSWAPSGGSAATAAGLGANAYTCTYTDSKGCPGTRNFTISNPTTPFSLSGNYTDAACGGAATGTATVTPTGGFSPYTYSWVAMSNTTASAGGLAPGSYSVICRDAGSCVDTQTFVIGQVPAPVPVTASSNPTTCSGTNGSITLSGMTAGAAYTVTYKKNGTIQAPLNLTATAGGVLTMPGLSAGAYSDIAAAQGSCIAHVTDTLSLADPSAPATPAPGNSGPICSGSSLQLTTTPVSNATYTWTGPNNFSSNAQNPLITSATAAASGNYSLTVTVAGCTSAPGSTNAVVHPTLVPSVTVTASPGNSICAGTLVTFTATAINGGNAVYQWRKNGSNVGTNSAAYTDSTLNNNDIITVRLTSDTLCRSTDTVNSTGITMTVTPYPVLAVTPATQTICSGGATSIALSAPQAGATYTWTVNQTGVGGATGGNGSSIAQTLSNSGTTPGTATYTVTPAIGTCVGNTATATVTVNPLPSATATPASQALCSGGTTSIALSANITGTTYTWTVAQNSVSGAAAGNGNTIAQTLTNTGIAAGTAIYTITPSVNGCPGAAVKDTVTVTPLPVLMATPSIQSLCSGTATSIALSAPQSGATYAWTAVQTGASGAAAGNGNSIAQTLTATGTAAGTVTYTITPAVGICNGQAVTATVTVKPLPVLTLTPSSQAICSGTATSIACSDNLSGTTYAWTVAQNGVTGATATSGGAIAQTLTNAGTTPGTAIYTVTPTNSSCPGTAVPVTVTVNPKPTALATPASQTLCSGAATNIALSSAVSGTTYTWTVAQTGVTGATAGSGNAIAQMLSTTAPVTGTAAYTITPSANSCAGSNLSVTVTINAVPAVPGAINGPDAPCAGSTQTYSVAGVTGASGYTWTLPTGWTGSSTTNSITVTVGSSNGNITVSAGNTCGSSAAAAKPVTSMPVLTPAITISHNAPVLLCSGSAVTYTASVTGGGTQPAYQWKRNGNSMGNNSSTFTYVPADGDTITCTLTSNYPCLNANGITSNSLIMGVTPTVDPVLNIYVPENHICSGIPVTFLATPTYGGTTPAYQWKRNNINVGTNSVNYTYTPSDGDMISCVLTSNAICASAATVISNEVPMSIVPVTYPSLNITANPGTQLSNGQPVTFSAQVSGAGASGYQVLWYRSNTLMGTGNTWTAIAGTDVYNSNMVKAYLQSFSPCAAPDSAWSNSLKITIGTTGIGDPGMPDDFKAYPNPAHGIVYFEGLHKGDQVNVYDASGRILLKQEAIDSKALGIDISRFAQGVYLFYFTNRENKRWQVKIFKD